MKMYVIEGTPEEVASVMRSVSTDPPKITANGPGVGNAAIKSPDSPTKFVTVVFARRVLKRLSLSVHMQAVLRKLYDAGDRYVATADLGASVKYSVPQFSGLMGAFGRRVANTDGFDEAAYFFDYRGSPGAWEYRLPPEVREAMELEGLA